MKAITEVLYQGPLITKATRAAILLHGRGGTARGLLNLADRFSDKTLYMALPQAANSTWYPYSFLADEQRNEPYLSNSVRDVYALIEETAQHIPKDRIFIVGFSQGACLALEVAARFATKYAGIIAFTGGLIGGVIDERKYLGDFKGTKVFISNGDADPHIPLQRSQESKEVMERLGAQVTLKVYKDKPHAISEAEIEYAKKNIF